MTIGSKSEKLTDVFPDILAQLKEGRKGQMQLFTPTESRGIQDEVLAAADSNVVEMYWAFQKAEDQYHKALEVDPKFTEAHANLGLLHLKTGAFEVAKSQLDKAFKIDPKDPITLLYLAQWAIKTEQTVLAWQYLEKSLENGYDDVKDIEEEADFEEMRKDPRWKELKEKHFLNIKEPGTDND